METTNIIPIEFLYTDSELVKIERSLLFKTVLTAEDLMLLAEIKEYMNKK